MFQISRRSAILGTLALPAAGFLASGRAAFAVGQVPAVDAATANARMVLSTDPRLTEFMRLLRVAHMEGACGGQTAYTIFPPSDASFASAPELMPKLAPWRTADFAGQAPAFPDTTGISAFVRRHVVAGKIDPQQIAGRSVRLTSLDGRPIELDGTGPSVRVRWESMVDGRPRSASLDGQPIRCSNAVIYVLSDISQA